MLLSCGPRPAVVGVLSRPAHCGLPKCAIGPNLLHRNAKETNICTSICRAVAKRGTKSRSETSDDDDVEEQGGSDLAAAPYQQTLNRSFILGGIGLHSGDYAWVRVRPAFAGEGRYFVRVPEGTNAHLFDPDATALAEHMQTQMEDDPEVENRRLLAFMQYVRAQEDGYGGSFEEYCVQTGRYDEVGGFPEPVVSDATEAPEPKSATADGVVDAHVRNLRSVSPYCTVLEAGEEQIASVEHLLAALEGLHVDNARIEIEGGSEVPVLDGSAQGWVEAIAEVGVRPAVTPESEEPVRKLAWRPAVPITAYDDDAFISLYPAGIDYLVSAGVNSDVPAIAQQWLTVNALGTPELNFAMDVAPARTWVESATAAYAMKDLGYLKAGTVGCVMVAKGDDWLSNADVRFLGDEPVRHNIIDVFGDLSLLGKDGHSGLPMGHIVAFNSNHHLQHEFVKKVQQAIEDGEMEAVPFVLTAGDVERIQAQLQEIAGGEQGSDGGEGDAEVYYDEDEDDSDED